MKTKTLFITSLCIATGIVVTIQGINYIKGKRQNSELKKTQN